MLPARSRNAEPQSQNEPRAHLATGRASPSASPSGSFCGSGPAFPGRVPGPSRIRRPRRRPSRSDRRAILLLAPAPSAPTLLPAVIPEPQLGGPPCDSEVDSAADSETPNPSAGRDSLRRPSFLRLSTPFAPLPRPRPTSPPLSRPRSRSQTRGRGVGWVGPCFRIRGRRGGAPSDRPPRWPRAARPTRARRQSAAAPPPPCSA